MKDNNFTIIEDIFETDTDINEDDYKPHKQTKDLKNTFIRTNDAYSVRYPYPTGDIPSLIYDEEMIKNKLKRQVNPRTVATQLNSLNYNNRIMQPPNHNNFVQNPNNNVNINTQSHNLNQSQNSHISNGSHSSNSSHSLTCRSTYDHIEHCPICIKYYKHANRTYILIIIFLIFIILLLMRQKS
jgi:hypothetical protein